MAKKLELIIETGGFRDMYHIRPPAGYKWKLWSFGQYGLSVILIKLELSEALQKGDE